MRWISAPLGSVLFLSLPFAAANAATAVPGEDSYKGQIQPVLEKFCFDCHADGVKKGKFAMDEHKDFADLKGDLKHWDHVRQMLNTHVMPPVNKDAPRLEQRDAVIKWIDDNVFSFDPANPDPGHVVIRRLNRSQYNNTVRDLLYMYDGRPADEFPPDDTGYGYDNIGAVLSLSPMLMEKYLRAARKITDSVMKVTAPEKASIEIGAGKFERKQGVDLDNESQGVLWYFGNAESKAYFQAPAEGTYRMTVYASAAQAGPDKARIAVTVDGKKTGEYEVTADWLEKATKWQKVEVEIKLSAGNHKLAIAFINDFYDEKLPEHHRDRNVAVDKVEVEGPIGLTPPRPSKFLQWLAPGVSFGLPAIELSGEDFSPGEGSMAERDTGAIYLASNGYVKHPLEIRDAGKYQFSMRAGALQAGNEPAKWEVRLDDKVVKAGEVTAKNQAPQWFKFEAEVQPGQHELRVAFLNDFYDEKTKADRNLWVHEVKVQGPVVAQQSLNPQDLGDLVVKTGGRLFRRPMTEEEKTKWIAFANQAVAAGEDTRGALSYVVQGMLASPAFLFHTQPTPAGSRLGKTELIDETSLASRLSYFLWSGPPDDRLLQLAAKGELRKNLAAEVTRMIADYRAAAMTDNFAGQWLQLRDVDLVSPNRKQFPEFDNIGGSMKKESEMFFDYILRGNRSVIEFLNADYTFVNRKLAQYYNLPGADKLKFKDKYSFVQVSLAGTPRGGIMTQGGILTVTSNPTRTNIVRRGKFILDNLLGMSPPPAPGDIPPLDEKEARFGKLTLRQQFEAHRKDTGCAGCHALLDPMGFALENYDAIGRWRDQDHKQPVDTTGKLIRGQEFKNAQDLREIMVRDMKGDFVRCLSENLLTFALGRGLEYSDRPAVREIVKRAESAGYRFQDIIVAVTDSVPFQRMLVE